MNSASTPARAPRLRLLGRPPSRGLSGLDLRFRSPAALVATSSCARRCSSLRSAQAGQEQAERAARASSRASMASWLVFERPRVSRRQPRDASPRTCSAGGRSSGLHPREFTSRGNRGVRPHARLRRSRLRFASSLGTRRSHGSCRVPRQPSRGVRPSAHGRIARTVAAERGALADDRQNRGTPMQLGSPPRHSKAARRRPDAAAHHPGIVVAVPAPGRLRAHVLASHLAASGRHSSSRRAQPVLRSFFTAAAPVVFSSPSGPGVRE